MSLDLLLDVEDHSKLNHTMSDDTGDISIDQDGEWDINLFDELDGLCDADELLRALVNADASGSAADLNLDIDPPVWDSDGWGVSADNTTGVSGECLSPSYTLTSGSSPGSVEALSPYSLHDDALSPLSPESQPSPLSVCSDSSGFVDLPLEQKPAKRTNQTRAKSAQTTKRPINVRAKMSIQPRPLLTTLPLPQVTAPLQAKTIIIQPVQTAILPVVKQSPVSIQPAPPAGVPVLMSPPTQVLQLHPSQTVPTRVLTLPALSPDGPAHTTVAAAAPPVSVSFQTSPSDEDSNISRRQQRMIKNRESASLSRRKKKEYLLTLEARLKVALCENEKLKSENGTLKRQLEGLRNENTVLKATAPKRRAVCLMVVLVFLVFNVGPMMLFEDTTSPIMAPRPGPSSRHLLDFSPEPDRDAGSRTVEWGPSNTAHRPEGGGASPEEKALMVVKRDPVFRPAPPCQPAVNKTKCMKMASELRGWVYRHETERTKSGRSSGGGGGGHPRGRTILRANSKKAEVAQIVTMQYSDSSEKRPGNELQVYYAPRHIYTDFFDEINRRGDTFYVVSFRRDHLLLPATNHNRGRRPKMSLVLPAMKVNDSVIKDKEFEVMMQIDCEVTDTRILHVKSSSIPPLLRVNETGADSLYPSAPDSKSSAPPLGVIVGSA
ncbi:cyclic AMP-dependent transcription factor ATF-6 alpha [Brachyhypopomus gauderio]|uniref:cyclic AMP-dependent transcription factor ATF-6 alpha n=1 Tax=Brachyhypopomus gauderio TaxID=698409 RepID=UPI004041387E